MADPKDKGGFKPQDLIDAKSNFDPHALAAGAGCAPATPDRAGAPQSTPQEVAEETRREQAARPDGRPDRDDRLTHIGRGDQTHG
jgi:hypothetical protein